MTSIHEILGEQISNYNAARRHIADKTRKKPCDDW
jgi:hypothetical protein